MARGLTFAVAEMQPVPPVAQGVEQDGLGAREDVEALGAELRDGARGVVPVAAGVLHAGDRAGVALQQALDQRVGEAHLRHRRDVIEVEPQAAFADPLDHLAEEGEQAVVGDALVIEGRQRQHAGAALVDRAAREPNRVGQRAAAGARQHARGRYARGHGLLQQLDALVDRERVAFGVGAEHREPAVLCHQPAAQPQEAGGVGLQSGVEGGEYRGEHAAQALGGGGRHLDSSKGSRCRNSWAQGPRAGCRSGAGFCESRKR